MIRSRLWLVTAVGSLALTSWNASTLADPATEVGRSHVAFAKALAADDLRFGPEDLSWLDAYEDSCGMSGLEALQAEGELPAPPEDEFRKHVLQNYLTLFCKPWSKLWLTIFEPCLQKPLPAWCDEPDGLYKHLNLDSYFGSMTGAIKSSRTALERYNLMTIMVNAIGAHVATQLPERRLEKWYALGTKEYLKSATIMDAQALVHQFQDTWVGLMPAVVSEFKSYAESADGVSTEEKERLLESLRHRFSDSDGGGV